MAQAIADRLEQTDKKWAAMDWWSSVNWNALSAIATAAMALTTFFVIKQTARNHRILLSQQSKEHMDRFKPICFLTPYSGVDPLDQRGGLVSVIDPETSNPAFVTVTLHCALQNVGVGPALKLRITFRSDNGWTSDSRELSPLGAGEKSGSTTAPLLIPIRAEMRQLFDVSWQIWLKYEDVFGRKFKTVHRSMTFDTWNTVNGQHKATLRPIPWTDYQEI